MSNPYETPESSGRLHAEENLNQYWRLVKNMRNVFYAYLLLAGPALGAFMWGFRKFAGMPQAEDALNLGISILFIAGLLWLGYKVVNVRCFQCGHKLAIGHFFLIKNVKCLGCGFKFSGT